MRRIIWLNALEALRRRHRERRSKRPAVRRHAFEPLEQRALLATLTVNSPLDTIMVGDGLVTLREAIIAANTNATTDLGHTGSGADTIQFDPAVFDTQRTIAPSFGELLVTEALTLNGPGRAVLTIDGGQSTRIFDIASTVTDITISGVTLVNGRATGDGGAIRSRASGTFTLRECTISVNAAAGRGGGVFCTNSLTIVDSTVIGNRTTGGHNGGGVFVSSGHPLTVNNTIITGNSADSGGGLYAGLSIGIVSSTITDNSATNSGGGFAVFNPNMLFTTSRITVVDSTISGNTARNGGGFAGATDVTVTNSLITENRAQEQGGGFSAPANSASGYATGQVTLTDTLITNNEAASGGGFSAADVSTLTNTTVTQNIGGGFFSRFGAELHSSTVTNNTSTGPGAGIHAPGGIQGLSGREHLAPANVTLNSSVVTGNVSTSSGGGIYTGGRLFLNSSTVSRNRATGPGGGIHLKTIYSQDRLGFFVTGSATINSSTISDNESQARGGGIDARWVTMDLSTVSGNKGTTGGGIYSHNDAIIKDSTITANVATSGTAGGIWNGDDEIVQGRFNDPSTVSIERTILAENSASAGSPDLRPGGGTLTVKSSLIGDNAGTSLAEAQSFDANGNLVGSAAGVGAIDPRLGPLADNGGPTQTHALLEDSRALDTIPYYSSGPVPAHEYLLNGSLADPLGGPSLVALGGTLTDTGYNFSANQGLNASSVIANPVQFSIEIVFKWSALSGGFQKIIDFHNLTSDAGLYTVGNGLHFANGAFAGDIFAAEMVYHLVLTRDDATDVVRAYINGSEVWNFVDSAGLAMFDGPQQIARFFQDDTVTSQSQVQSGFVDRIRIYNQVLSAAEVTTIQTAPLPSFPQFDQRGTPFRRVVDGDGVGGPQVDMGAYEFQQQAGNTPPVFTSPNAVSVAENATAVTTVMANDNDVPAQTVTFSIVGGADQAKFAITSGGALSFVTATDFEMPTDAGADNMYVVDVQADDGNGGTAVQTITVTVNPVNDNQPVFTSAAAASVAENSTAVMTVAATDADLPAQGITFSIVGGEDEAGFAVSEGGALSFNAPPDFEAPGDANSDNIYNVVVLASDNTGGRTLQTIQVTVTPVDDNPPQFTSSDTISVPENTTAVVSLTATDEDLPPQAVTFAIVGGADAAKFTLVNGNELKFVAPPDYDQPGDANGDNLYVVIVEANSGDMSELQAVLVTVVRASGLPGDYNGNGVVDAADYVVWRKTMGQTVSNGSGADGSGNGMVDTADHGVWQQNFGRSSLEPASAVATEASVAAATAVEVRDEHSPEIGLAIADQTTSASRTGAMERLHPKARIIAHRAGEIRFAIRDAALVAWLESRAGGGSINSPDLSKDCARRNADSDRNSVEELNGSDFRRLIEA